MSFEVELKAHVSDPLALQKRLELLPSISPAICELKQDTYFCRKGGDALFRMRLEQTGKSFESMQGSLVFTYKNKVIRDGIEVNEEVEFSSSSDQSPCALQFFLNMGHEVYITKTKRGYIYTYSVVPELPLLTIELVEVVALGWFIEMEFVLEDKSLIEQARYNLLLVLDSLGIGRSDIEDRYYMHLLKKKKPEA
ncbi:MAG TPA: CYTH domain-containing protein [Sphaerochaeta sp.]|nr:CYTH domain-containing protein [Sphaerochaeta sp.]